MIISLNCLNIAQSTSLLFAIVLPSVANSVYFYAHNESKTSSNSSAVVEDPALQLEFNLQPKSVASSVRCCNFSFRRAILLLWSHFIDSYSDPVVVQWSIWWALTMCEFNQVLQVEAALTICGAAGAFAAGFINNGRFERWSLWVLSIVSCLMGAILLSGTLTPNVWVSYSAYVLFGTATHFMVTIAR